MDSTQFSLFFSSLLLLVLISSAAGDSQKTPVGFVGGYQPIHNVKDPYVVDVAKFALAQHNKDASDNLIFLKVSSGQQQVVAGTNYKLNIVARHAAHGAPAHYVALVYDKPWENLRTLTSFDKA